MYFFKLKFTFSSSQGNPCVFCYTKYNVKYNLTLTDLEGEAFSGMCIEVLKLQGILVTYHRQFGRCLQKIASICLNIQTILKVLP